MSLKNVHTLIVCDACYVSRKRFLRLLSGEEMTVQQSSPSASRCRSPKLDRDWFANVNGVIARPSKDRGVTEDGPARLFIVARSDHRFTQRLDTFTRTIPSPVRLADRGRTIHFADYSRAASGYDSGLSSTPLTTENIAAFAPISSASAAIACRC